MARLTRIQTQVALATRHKVGGWAEGVHASVNAGRSLEFHDLREYARGDDVADIDWKASARRGSLLVKRHVAERRATLLLAAQTGRAMAAMASAGTVKRDLALDAAATFASLALAHGDYVGVIHRGGATVSARPTSRAVHVERMLTALERSSTPTSPDADLAGLLDTAATVTRRRGIVAIVCGDVEIDAHLEARLRRLVVQHEVLVVVVPDIDPTDPALEHPLFGVDNERPLPRLRDRTLRDEWLADVAARAARRSAALSRLSIRSTTLAPDEPVVPQVLSLVRSVRRAA
ncbi:MAG: DUF58 domain-containing protein [Propionibacterium sp.]|nr:DUF58 domain-containing protein [Propionibacterium sp.]